MTRKHFPFFNNYNNTTFLDSASSCQKPKCMLYKIYEFYSYSYSNIHRGNYDLSFKLTKYYEDVRTLIARFINAVSTYEIIFTSGSTESTNIVARTFEKKMLERGEEIIISNIEHHSNIIPWQYLCKSKRLILTIITINKSGAIRLKDFKKIISIKTKIISITHISNILGNVINVKEISNFAKSKKIMVFIDATQSISHIEVDVQKINCDFLIFSAHKIYGPNSLGILYIRYSIIIKMEILSFGSSTMDYITLEQIRFLPPPYKFEPGTPHICEVISFGETIKYILNINIKKFWQREKELINILIYEIKKLSNLYILNVPERKSIISIVGLKLHFEDINNLLNKEKISTRSGIHCAKPLIDFLSIEGTIRISLGIYNNYEDIKSLLRILKNINSINE